jgi:voltage-gated potassium channel Kch
MLQAAGATEADYLVIAVDNPQKTHQIVETANKHFPNLTIIARSSTWDDSYELLDAGVMDIYRETFESALRLGADVLGKLGQRRFQTHRALKTFRKHDERFLRELAEMRHDRKQLIRGARQRIEDLEQLMLSEQDTLGKDKDLGWDATTLIEEYGEGRPVIK